MTVRELILHVISNCETEEKANFPIFHWIAPNGSLVYAAESMSISKLLPSCSAICFCCFHQCSRICWKLKIQTSPSPNFADLLAKLAEFGGNCLEFKIWA
jgi:hypothetical protein